jgi:hypothetical protein
VNEDDLRRLGLRLRPRSEPKNETSKPGKIAFDDLGNAIYEWKDRCFEEDSESGERARRRALAHPGLAVVEEEPNPNDPVRINPKGLRVGYNPYESGLLKKKDEWKRKRDLRELSKWIELKKKVTGDSGQ